MSQLFTSCHWADPVCKCYWDTPGSQGCGTVPQTYVTLLFTCFEGSCASACVDPSSGSSGSGSSGSGGSCDSLVSCFNPARGNEYCCPIGYSCCVDDASNIGYCC